MLKYLASLALFGSVFSATGQQNNFIGDLYLPSPVNTVITFQGEQPSMNINPAITPRGSMIWQSNVYHSEYNGYWAPRAITTIYNQSLFRFGVSHNVEFRLTTDFRRITTFPGYYSESRSVAGLSPVNVGFKVKVLSKTKFFANSAVVANMGLKKVAVEDLRTPYNAHNIIFTSSLPIKKRFELQYNAGLLWNGYDADTYYLGSILTAYKISKRWMVYSTALFNTDYNNTYNSGVMVGTNVLFGSNFMCGAAVGHGFDEFTTNWMGSFGFTWQFDLKK